MCAWSAPYTFTDDQVVTASILDTYVSDDLTYLYENRFDESNFDYAGTAARCTAGTAVNSFRTDVPGCSVTLNRNGTWVIIGVFGVTLGGVSDADVHGELMIGGTTQTGEDYALAATGVQGTLLQVWTKEVTNQPLVAKLQTYYTNVGASIQAGHTAILAFCGAA